MPAPPSVRRRRAGSGAVKSVREDVVTRGEPAREDQRAAARDRLRRRRAHAARRAGRAGGHASVPRLNRQRHPPTGVLHAPVDHRADDRPQFLALRGQQVLHARRVLAVAVALDDARPHQPLQPVGQGIGGNALPSTRGTRRSAACRESRSRTTSSDQRSPSTSSVRETGHVERLGRAPRRVVEDACICAESIKIQIRRRFQPRVTCEMQFTAATIVPRWLCRLTCDALSVAVVADSWSRHGADRPGTSWSR